MRAKLKLLILMSLVSLMVVIPAFNACAPQQKPLADLVIKLDWVEPVALAAKSYDPPKSLRGEYGTFHVLVTISNPNDMLVTIDNMEFESWGNDIGMGILQTDGPIYIPPGKEVTVRFPVTLNSFRMVQEVVMLKHKAVPDALKMVLGTWKAIQDGTAPFRIKGGAQVIAGSTTRFQNFDLRWP